MSVNESDKSILVRCRGCSKYLFRDLRYVINRIIEGEHPDCFRNQYLAEQPAKVELADHSCDVGNHVLDNLEADCITHSGVVDDENRHVGKRIGQRELDMPTDDEVFNEEEAIDPSKETRDDNQ